MTTAIVIICFCILLVGIGIGYTIEWHHEQQDNKDSLNYEMKGKNHERKF